jgi:hypothetical protein
MSKIVTFELSDFQAAHIAGRGMSPTDYVQKLIFDDISREPPLDTMVIEVDEDEIANGEGIVIPPHTNCSIVITKRKQ